jgi:hypothetical protein
MSVYKKPKVLFYPSAVYDVAQFVMFPLNCLISGLCYLQPSKSIWNEEGFENKKLLGSGKTLEQLRAEILRQDGLIYNEEDLVRLYDSLPTVNAKNYTRLKINVPLVPPKPKELDKATSNGHRTSLIRHIIQTTSRILII